MPFGGEGVCQANEILLFSSTNTLSFASNISIYLIKFILNYIGFLSPFCFVSNISIYFIKFILYYFGFSSLFYFVPEFYLCFYTHCKIHSIQQTAYPTVHTSYT